MQTPKEHLTEHCPNILSKLTDMEIAILCKVVGIYGLDALLAASKDRIKGLET